MNKVEQEIIGYIGCFLLIISFTPQIYKTFKTKKAEDISNYTVLLQILTCIFSLVYAIIIEANPIILSNAVVLLQLIFLLYASIYYVKNNSKDNLKYLNVSSI